jgi:TolA-binding protein
LLLFCLVAGSASSAFAALDELPVERWAKLREAERYQLNIAEKYYREQNWKVALAEYEKFLSLYEKSEGAAYAQLKWSLCQTNLRKLNTAIKDGYQSILDYWPDAPEAVSAAYLIGRTYKDMGEIDKAKKSYSAVMTSYPTHLVAVLAKLDLVSIAGTQQDTARQVELWKDLAFDTPRTVETAPHCANASCQLAVHDFLAGAFDDAVKALATSCTEAEMPYSIWYHARQPLWDLTGVAETKERGDKVAAAAVAYIQQRIPSELKDDQTKAMARQLWYYIAELNSYARHAAEVGQVYEKMLSIFGVDDDILGRLAGWFKANNRRDDARRTFARFTNQIEGQNQQAYMFREEQKWDQAIPIYKDLAARDAEHADRWHWEIAISYRDWGKYKEAIGVFRQTENYPENIKQMAWCHRQLGEFKEAIGLYRQVMAGHEPSAPWALLQIAYTEELAKQPEAAIKSFQQVCKKFPKTGEASQAHAHLQNQYKITATLGGAKDE